MNIDRCYELSFITEKYHGDLVAFHCGFIGDNSVDIQNSKISKGLDAAKSSIRKLEGI